MERYRAVLFDRGSNVQTFTDQGKPRFAILDTETEDYLGNPRLYSSLERAEREAARMNDRAYSEAHRGTALVAVGRYPLPDMGATGKAWDRGVKRSVRFEVPAVVECLRLDVAEGRVDGIAVDVALLRRAVWLLSYPEDWGHPSRIPEDEEVIYCEECGLPITFGSATYLYPEDWPGYEVPRGPLCEGCMDELREGCEPVAPWETDPDWVIWD